MAEIDRLQQQVAQLIMQLERHERLATLGMLSGLVAHEYNNILTPMSTMVQLALSHPADHALAQRAVRQASEGIRRATKISELILGMAGRAKGTESVCRVSAAVQAAIESLPRSLEQDGVTVEIATPKGLWARIAPVALQHILLNLLLNARSAILRRRSIHPEPLRPPLGTRQAPGLEPTGQYATRHAIGSRIWIRSRICTDAACSTWNNTGQDIGSPPTATTAAAPGEHTSQHGFYAEHTALAWVQIEVEDEAGGMPAKVLRELRPGAGLADTLGMDTQPVRISHDARVEWTQLTAAGETATDGQIALHTHRLGAEEMEGTGLGLLVCQRLAEAAGGRLHIRSTPEVGTCCQILLPVATAHHTD